MTDIKANELKSEVLDKGLSGMVRPMLIEWLILLTVPVTDTFFLSLISNEAAAAVGMVMPLILGSFIIIEAMCIGGGAVAGQRIGRDDYEGGNLSFGALFFLICVGLLIVVPPLVIFAPELMNLMGLPPEIGNLGAIYLSISAFMLVWWGLGTFYKTIMNAYGHPKWNFYATGLLTLCNVISNYIIVFGVFGFPKLGIAGVAYATLLSTFLSLLFLYGIATYKLKIKIPYLRALKGMRDLYRPIVRIGVPSTFEPISFQLSALLINVMIAKFGTDIIAARVYAHSTYTYCLVISISFGIATQTIIAQLVGKRLFDEAYVQLFRSLKATLFMAGGLAFLFLAFHGPIMDIFTDDPNIMRLAFIVFLLYFLTEIPRSINVVATGSLKASGDAWFISVSALVITWLVAIPAAYVLGFYFALGLTGVLAAVLLDEGLRATINLWRWRQRRWESYAIKYEYEVAR